MLNMLDDKKKKEGTALIVNRPEVKASGAGGVVEQIFSAMQAGDKQSFERALNIFVEKKIMEMEMGEEE